MLTQKERYDFIADSGFARFTFKSIGLKGVLTKVIEYTPIYINGVKLYNLGFGDLDENTGELDDMSISNNGDRDKVLATVAATLLDFISYIPDARIYVEGSTVARTRLYQIALMANLNEITQILNVYGLRNEKWQEFNKGTNYQAFIVVRKL